MMNRILRASACQVVDQHVAAAEPCEAVRRYVSISNPHHAPTQQVGQDVPGDVVLGGTEAAGHQHGVGTGARQAEHLRDAVGVVPHDWW